MRRAINCFVLMIVVSCSPSDAATIHECRAYNGSTFYSSGPCSGHKAVGVINHDVPDGMPFEQQVKLVEDAKGRRSAQQQADTTARNRASQCEEIDRELQELRTKYTSWQYVPIDQVNADQVRERDLKSRRSSLRCYSR